MSYTTKWVKQTTYVHVDTGETLVYDEKLYYIIKTIQNGREIKQTRKSITRIIRYIKLIRERPIQQELEYTTIPKRKS